MRESRQLRAAAADGEALAGRVTAGQTRARNETDDAMEDDAPTAPRADRRGIQSVEVGGTLLQALVRHGGPMMLKDLAADAGMPAAKAHPYLVSFGKLGLIEQDPASGRYGLGPFALQMGLTALHALDPLKAALNTSCTAGTRSGCATHAPSKPWPASRSLSARTVASAFSFTCGSRRLGMKADMPPRAWAPCW